LYYVTYFYNQVRPENLLQICWSEEQKVSLQQIKLKEATAKVKNKLKDLKLPLGHNLILARAKTYLFFNSD